MDVLRNLFGGFTSTLFRLVLFAGTMALIYVFAIRPVLDTTEEIANTSSQNFGNSFQQSFQQSIQQQIAAANRQIQQQLAQTNSNAQPPTQTQITRVVHGLTPAQARRLNRCVQRAGARVAAFNACFDRFDRRR